MENIIIKDGDEIIKVEDGSQVFIFDFVKKSENPTALKIRIGNDCVIEYVAIYNCNLKREIIVGDNCTVNMKCLYLEKGKFEINTFLNNNSIFNNQVLLNQKEDSLIEVRDNYIFQGQGTRGRFLIKALASDKAIINYFSDIIINKEAIFTDARIDMQLGLLNKEAKGVILPGLKVATSKVKAGHGASTFQLSPEDLFYLNSRGLNAESAKSLIISSAALQFTNGIKDEKVKELILELLAV